MFEYLQDELKERQIINDNECEDYVFRVRGKHFRSERLLKLLIKKGKCQEFVSLLNEMSCQRHISEKIEDEIQRIANNTQLSIIGNVHLCVFYSVNVVFI